LILKTAQAGVGQEPYKEYVNRKGCRGQGGKRKKNGEEKTVIMKQGNSGRLVISLQKMR
jgi:hypothetical protein